MTLGEILNQIEASRSWFLKLVEGLNDEQWEAHAFPNTKSPKETLAHLIISDRCMPDFFSGKEPDYEAFAPDSDLSAQQLLSLMKQTHPEKMEWLRRKFKDADINAEMQTVYSGMKPIWSELMALCHEDWYHIGQVSMIRQGSDQEFDYYATFYG